MKAGHLKWFDAGRGIAAIVVLLDHSFYVLVSRQGPIVLALGVGAEYAVYLFFFMSGFLIALSIRNNILKAGRFNLLGYAIARASRIYPPLIGAILIIVICGMIIRVGGLPDLHLPDREQFTFNNSEIFNSLTMRSGLLGVNGSLWSLYIEGQIYIVIGGISAIIFSRHIIPVIAGILAAYVGYRLAAHTPYFAFYAAIWLAGAAASFLPLIKIFDALPKPPEWLTATGDFSYSLYVIHFPLLLLSLSFQNIFSLSDTTKTLWWIATTPFVLLISYFFSRLFERPKELRSYIEDGLRRVFGASVVKSRQEETAPRTASLKIEDKAIR